jgi:ribosomal protein L35AE/L33A
MKAPSRVASRARRGLRTRVVGRVWRELQPLQSHLRAPSLRIHAVSSPISRQWVVCTQRPAFKASSAASATSAPTPPSSRSTVLPTRKRPNSTLARSAPSVLVNPGEARVLKRIVGKQRIAYVYKAQRPINGSKVRVIWGKVTRSHGQFTICLVQLQQHSFFLHATNRQLWGCPVQVPLEPSRSHFRRFLPSGVYP